MRSDNLMNLADIKVLDRVEEMGVTSLHLKVRNRAYERLL
jgi:hypothetical protein